MSSEFSVLGLESNWIYSQLITHNSKLLMSSRKLIWLGFFVGSTIGGLLPAMWGDDMISTAGILLSLAGGIAGIWAGYRLAKLL